MELVRGGASFLHDFPSTDNEISRSMNDFGRLLRTAMRVSRTRYPGFIFGLPVARGEIPIFTYHDVETQVFARDLEFLHANGYRTLSLDESRSLSVLNATKNIAKLKIAPVTTTSQPGASPTRARARKMSQNRARSSADTVGIGSG